MNNVQTDKYIRIERGMGVRPFLGRKYIRPGKDIVHEFRCPICGKWLNYSTKDIDKLVLANRWDFEKNRLAHCGNSLCEEYYRRWKKHQETVAKDFKGEMLKKFRHLKTKGLLA